MENKIQYAYAQHNISKEPIHISQASNFNKEHFTCLDCKEILIPVLKHKTPHFRHKPDSTCFINNESQVHWLSKEACKQLKEISFPEILTIDLPHFAQAKYETKIYNYVKSKVPKVALNDFFESLTRTLAPSITLPITKVETEKTYTTDKGDVRIDVVLTIQTKTQSYEVFIEPHYTNPISSDKLEKLKLLDIPTLSISLYNFIEEYPNYTIKDLTNYIQKDYTKYWSHIRPTSIESNINKYFKYIDKKISDNKITYQQLSKNQKLIGQLQLLSNQEIININDHYQAMQHHEHLNNALKHQINIIKKYPFRTYKQLKILDKKGIKYTI
jgi:hypothetical protein